MRGLRTFINSLLLAGIAFAQTPDYFPLEVGNVWMYKSNGRPRGQNEQIATVEVTRAGNFKGLTYYLLSGYRPGDFWVRIDGTGRVYQYDETAGDEKLWYDFSRKEGDTYMTSLPTCCGRARVISTNASKQVALGTFDKAFLQLTYPGVFQVGITEENFLPYVGLAYRGENTGGPSSATQDLVYAKISGVTVLNASGLGFGVARANGYARIFVNNNTGAPLRVAFASGQTYELTLKDTDGKVLYRWSDGKGFTQALRAVDLPAGETSWPVAIPDVPGVAALTAELVTLGQRFTARIPLETGSPSRP